MGLQPVRRSAGDPGLALAGCVRAAFQKAEKSEPFSIAPAPDAVNEGTGLAPTGMGYTRPGRAVRPAALPGGRRAGPLRA